GPERPRQRARRGAERQALRFGHVAMAHEQEKGFVGPPALETLQRDHVGLERPGAHAVHRFGRVGDQPARAQVGHGGREGRLDLRGRAEGQRVHRSSRANASAIRKSSAVVTLRLCAVSGITSTGNPARSHSSASSVGTESSFRSRAYASSSIARGNPCGVCARHRRCRETVRVIRLPSTTSFTVSFNGTAATAPTPARARAITLSIVSRLTNGRAPSCTSTTLAPAGSARNPAPTDWARAAPPGTRRRRSPTSFPSHSGGRSAKPAGTATTTWPTAGCDVKGRSVRSSIGTPWMGRNCFGSPGPARTPAPAATITTPTSGGEAVGELTDPIHPDHVEVGDAAARARRQEDAPESLAGRFCEAPLHARHRPDLPAQPYL